MVSATQAFHNRIAIVFDFDLTLAPASMSAVVSHCGLDPDDWRRDSVQPLLDDGWEEILAQVFTLVEFSRNSRKPITRQTLDNVGKALEPYEGVLPMFDALRATAAEVEPEIGVEFHVVSSGLFDVMRFTAIAPKLDSLWGSKLAFDPRDEALRFPKLIITHPEKVRYLLALCKGSDPSGANAPADVFQSKSESEWHVPIDQVIYVGDGISDMPVFRLMNERGGIALGVFKGEQAKDWKGQKRVDPSRRIQNLAPTDYREGSELITSLKMAVRSIANKVALRRLSIQE